MYLERGNNKSGACCHELACYWLSAWDNYYNGGPTDIRSTVEDVISMEVEESVLPPSRGTPRDVVTEESDELPQRKMLPLNLRRVVLQQLRTLASMLGICAKATAAQTRQLIEGKLVKLDHEPRSVQVTVGEDSRLYLLDDTGVIKSSEAMEGTGSDHVQTNYELCDNEHNEHDDSIESLHSALCLKTEQLQLQLSTHNDELERVYDEHDQLKTDKAELNTRFAERLLNEIECGIKQPN